MSDIELTEYIDGTVEIYLSKVKLIILNLLSLGFIILGFIIFFNDDENKFKIITSILIIVFFSISFFISILLFIRSFIYKKAVLILDNNGITYNILTINKELFIKWHDINNIVFSNTFIFIYLKDRIEFFEKNYNKKVNNNKEPIIIHIANLNLKNKTIIHVVRYFFDKYKNS